MGERKSKKEPRRKKRERANPMYQPKISDEHIRKLYQLKLQDKKPMTHVLDGILKAYFDSHRQASETKEANEISVKAKKTNKIDKALRIVQGNHYHQVSLKEEGNFELHYNRRG